MKKILLMLVVLSASIVNAEDQYYQKNAPPIFDKSFNSVNIINSNSKISTCKIDECEGLSSEGYVPAEYDKDGFNREGINRDGYTQDEVARKSELLKKMKDESITNYIANNLNRDISINYFNPSEQSVLFNTYIDESSVGFDVNDAESVKGRLRSTGVTKVNNMRASQINIEELFIGIHQGKIKKIIIENAIGEKQEYYNLKLKNINNEYFEISGDYDQQGRMNLYFSSESENLVGKFTSTNLNHKFNYMIFNKEGKGYVYDLYKKNKSL